MRKAFVGAFVVGMVCVASVVNAAEMKISPSAAAQFTRKAPESSKGNIDGAFVRGEVKFQGILDNDVEGLVHLRLQSNYGDARTTALYVRQCYMAVPLSIVTLQAGRWYESYTAGYYFGRYLTELSTKKDDNTGAVINAGSGSMNTNYTVVDGARAKIAVEKIKTDFYAAVLTKDAMFENVSTMLRLSSKPVKGLSLGVGGMVQTLHPKGTDRNDRLMASAGYSPLEKLSLDMEYGITDLAEAQDNMWFMWRLQVPAWKILDKLSLEVEYKQNRVGEATKDAAWAVVMSKTLRKVTFDLDIGADPMGWGSEDGAGVGGTMRMTLKL